MGGFTPQEKSHDTPSAPAVLGLAGVLPFLALTLLALFSNTLEKRELAVRGFVLYGAIISSFLGGVRWGAAMPLPSFRLLSMAVAPSLIAFGCLLLPSQLGLGILGVLFAVMGLVDTTRGTHALWPNWYKRLRLRLTIAVVGLHLVVYFGTRGVF